ncbi:hypothetical protein [Acidithiobacillus thiooxidans]|uniref:hypothetical protein n=1 Tax=Acidithiobacillus thiooxidans TaxID=930 RepID=UPI0004E0DF7C|nr:hypothetical protein [Acidithiobacillus thiooxidans]
MDAVQIQAMVDRLEDSEEYTGDAAIPPVAEAVAQLLREILQEQAPNEYRTLVENAQPLGDLISFDRPFVSLYWNTQDKPRFLLRVWVDQEDSVESWLWLELTREMMEAYLTQKIGLDECYRRSPLIIEQAFVMNAVRDLPLQKRDLTDLPHSWIPVKHAFLDADDDFTEILDKLSAAD